MALSRVAIVLHGNESINQGGPSVRGSILADQLRALRIDARIFSDLRTGPPEWKPDIVHVFNSVPHESALQQLEFGRRQGARTVLSPIVVNEGLAPLYRHAVPTLLREGMSAQHVRDGFEVIDRAYSSGADIVDLDQLRGLAKLLDVVDAVIYLSELERDFTSRFFAAPPLSRVIPNGIEVDRFGNGNADEFRSVVGGNRFVLTVGRVEPRKNQAAVALAARAIDIPYVCIGAALDEDYLASVRKCAPSHFVHVQRSSNRDFLASAYKAAAAFCLPSWAEGAPLSAIEAYAAGTPLILSSMSSEAQYFGSDARYVRPSDIGQLQTAISSILNSGVGERVAARRDASRFDTAHSTDATLGFYREVFGLEAIPDASAFLPPRTPVRTLKKVSVDVVPFACRPTPPVRMRTIRENSFSRTSATAFKQVLNSLPPRIRRRLLQMIRFVSPQFSPVVPDAHRIGVPKCLRSTAENRSLFLMLTVEDHSPETVRDNSDAD